MSDDAKYYNSFNLINEVGPVRFKKLYNYFNSLRLAWETGKTELQKIGFDEKLCEAVIEARKKISPDKEWEKLIKNNISVITIKDGDYPKLLKEIYAPPAILYVRGNLKTIKENPLAIVGSRKISCYGRQAIESIVPDLANAGITIISGMALGIDTFAHETAIAHGGKTIAILASGLDPANLSMRGKIVQKIIENGALLSEYPFGKPAMKHHFPIRNRIVSGLSRGVLVIEAAKESGALITARMALEENREVFAIPGSIYWPNSEGTNNLIKNGARAITSAEEILEELGLTKKEKCTNNIKMLSSDPKEQKIRSILKNEPLHIDTIAKKSKINSSEASSLLMLMEMKGLVKNLGGGNYIIAK